VSYQDAVPTPRVRLRLVMALLRLAAGRRGHASVTWHGAGFTYALAAVREDGDDLVVIVAAVADLVDRLRTQP